MLRSDFFKIGERQASNSSAAPTATIRGVVGLLCNTQPRNCDLNANVQSLFGAFLTHWTLNPVNLTAEYARHLIQLDLQLPCV